LGRWLVAAMVELVVNAVLAFGWIRASLLPNSLGKFREFEVFTCSFTNRLHPESDTVSTVTELRQHIKLYWFEEVINVSYYFQDWLLKDPASSLFISCSRSWGASRRASNTS
jgi:hypothetical protein